MRHLLKNHHSFFSGVALKAVFFFFSFQVFSGKLEMDIYNVGQGNCVLVKASHPQQDPKYLLVDIGTAAYKKERAFTQQLSPTSVGSAVSSNLADSTIEEVNPRQPQEDPSFTKESSSEEEGKKQKNPQKRQKIDQNDAKPSTVLIDNLRKILKNGDIIKSESESEPESDSPKKRTALSPIHIQTVVITHPDSDHYGWLPQLFSEKQDHIEHLILGGLPEKYDLSGNRDFQKWLQTRLDNHSKIYFPAIRFEPITALEEVLPKPGRTFSPHRYTIPGQPSDLFPGAFDFGDGIQVSCLSINPTHFIDGNKDVMRMSYDEDSNADSLALKVENKEKSAILTGDATHLTTTRIISNHKNTPDFLKTDMLLASHHGSFSYGSNESPWIQATQPKMVLISSGISQGHPAQGAYDAFKQSPRLQQMPRHKVLVANSKNEWTSRTTAHAIYSTLASGNLTVTFDGEGAIQLKEEKNPPIQFPQTPEVNKSELSDSEDVDIEENEDGEVRISPKKTTPSPEKDEESTSDKTEE